MATIVKAGTARVEVKQADMAGIEFVPHALGPDEIVLLTARSTNQASPPKGAGPLWRDFMEDAVPARPARSLTVPEAIVEKYVDPRTGLLVRSTHSRALRELFHRYELPPRDRFWRTDRSLPPVR